MSKEISVKDLAAALKLKTKALIAEMETREGEACHLRRATEDDGRADAEIDARLYLHAVQGLLSDLRDADNRLKYLLGDIDAEGELYYYEPNERYRLPATSGRADDYLEFSCGMLIEVWSPDGDYIQSGEWNCDRVEYSDSYSGYYLYYAKKPLAPGMRARHRHNCSWD